MDREEPTRHRRHIVTNWVAVANVAPTKSRFLYFQMGELSVEDIERVVSRKSHRAEDIGSARHEYGSHLLCKFSHVG